MKFCPKCNQEKEEMEFSPNKKRHDGLASYCRPCNRAFKKEWKQKNKVKKQESDKRYREKHKEEIKEKKKEWVNQNKEYLSTYLKGWRAKLKQDVLNFYGTSCVCCKESLFQLLTIDHVNGRTTEDNLNTYRLYKYLAERAFPVGYQTMCFNCNIGKRINNGLCPHQSQM